MDDPVYVYAVTRERETGEDRGWAEMDDDLGVPVVHRTQAAAERAMAALSSAGKNPAVYGGHRVEKMIYDEMKMLLVD